MPSAYDLYTFYLSPEHLKGRSVAVAVEAVTVEEVYNPRIKRGEPRLIIRFHGKKLALCANKTQISSLIEITGTDDYTKWIGHMITLTPATIDRQRQTITITPAPAKPEPAAPASSEEPAPASSEETAS